MIALEPQPVEKIEEGRATFLIEIEAEKTALCHVIYAFQLASQIAIGVPPRSQLVDIPFRESMLVRDGSPEACDLGELWSERLDRVGWTGGFDLEVGSDLWPHPSPAEDISIDDIEGLIPGLRRYGGPLQMMCEKASVS